jgi:hypothetical protein
MARALWAERLRAGAEPQDGALLVWYCKRCRRVLRTDPRGVHPQGCKCKVPILPRKPTRVVYA